MVFIWVGCNSKSGKEGPLVFAVGGVPAELEVWEKVAADFTSVTGDKVVLLRQPADSDQRRQGLVVALQSGQPEPDVFLMDVAWTAQFAASKWLAPLDSAGEGDSLPGPEAFPAGASAAGAFAGRRVAFPVYVDGGLLYYRRDLLAKYGYDGPPSTWEDLVAMSRKVQASERKSDPAFYGYVWQGAQYEGLVCNFLEVAASAGGGFPQRGNEGIAVNLEPNVKALNLMRSMLGPKGISPPETFTTMKEEETRLYFQKGSALFERNWPYAWALHQQPGSPVRGKIGIAPLPHFPDHASAAVLGGWQVGISRFTRRGARARKLVRYLVSLPVQKRLALDLGWNPGRIAVYRDSSVLDSLPHFRELGAVFAHTVARPNLPYWTRLSEVLQRHLNAALAGKVEPKAALQAAAEEADAITARYRNVAP